MKRRLFRPAAEVGAVLPLNFDGASAADQSALSIWLDVVLDKNPRVRAAQSALDAAQARERTANQPLYPGWS